MLYDLVKSFPSRQLSHNLIIIALVYILSSTNF